MAAYYLVLNTEQTANTAHRKIKANYIRYRASTSESKGFGHSVRLSDGTLIDPSGRTDDELNDNYTFAMFGYINGVPNTDYGFTYRWSENPIQRLDGKWVIPLIEPGDLQDALMFGVPQPNSIEIDDGTWFN